MSSGKKKIVKLYIAEDAHSFIENTSIPITLVNNDNVHQVIEQYARLKKRDQPLVLYDIYYLSQSSQSLLLKFLEDTELSIILLASSDNLSPMLVNRVTEIHKHVPKTFSRFISAPEFRSSVDLRDLYCTDVVKKQMQNSPLSYRNDGLVSNFSNKEKLLGIIENEYKPKN